MSKPLHTRSGRPQTTLVPLRPGGAPRAACGRPDTRWRGSVRAAALAALVAACDGPAEAPGAAATPGSPAASAAAAHAASNANAPAAAASTPPVSVTLVVARRRDLPVVLEGTGTVTPVTMVEVRPQLSSVITKVLVREGQFVRAGQPLFTLDAAADEANVARLNAQLARDEAALADAGRQLNRSRELLAQNFISQGAVDSGQTLVETQSAAVAASRAAVAAARVPLGYSRIVAPNGGRVGAINLFPGSAVQANVTTMATITQLDPIEVTFTVPQRFLGDVLAALHGGGAGVVATLPEGATGLNGHLVFVDNAIDPASGTVKVKARLPNKDNKLWPGAFVRTTLTVRSLKDAVVVPQAAIIQGARGTIVYVVETGRAAARPVQVLATQGEDAAVAGLRPGERLVLDGRQNLRPGSAVVERAREGGGGRPGAASGPRSAPADGISGGSRGAADPRGAAGAAGNADAPARKAST